MNIILATDAVTPPLTGIGRYTWELGTRLPALVAPDTLRFISRGRWVDTLATQLTPAPARAAIRRSVLRSRLAAMAYALIWPVVMRQRLRRVPNSLYHGTNFYIPPGADRAVATFHDLSIYRYPEFHPASRVEFMQRAIPASLKRADFLITVSEFTRREVLDYFGWPQDRIRAIPLGVTAHYHPHSAQQTQATLAPLGLQHGQYALCTATIEPRKNIERLLQAYALQPIADRRRYPLVLAGGRGWNDAQLIQRIAAAQAEGWLHHLGYVDQSLLPQLIAGARCFIFPSLYEGFGLPVLEAMASGVPVVTADCASLPEVAQGAALLVNPLELESIAAGITRALQDDDWCHHAVAAGLRVAAEYSWDKTAQQTVEVYRQIGAMR